MKLTAEKKNEILDELKSIRASIEQFSLENINLSTNARPSKFAAPPQLTHFLHKFVNVEEHMYSQIQSKRPSFSFTKPSLPLNDIFNLLGDLLQGKTGDYLQEVLANAVLNLKVKQKDSADPYSRQVLDINIQVAATIIDKYASLLEIVLGQDKFTKEQQALVTNVHEKIDNTNKKIQCINLRNALKNLPQSTKKYIDDHDKRLWCFIFFNPGPSGQYDALIKWLDDLSDEELTYQEILGGIYIIRDQIDKLSVKRERDAIRDGLDSIISMYKYPEYNKESIMSNLLPYVEKFKRRAHDLELKWPANFTKYETSQLTPV